MTALELGIFPTYLRSLGNAARALRLGTEYGGWVVPEGMLDRTSLCYCVGCGEDISFDLALIDRYQCEVYGFDPTPRAASYVRSVTADQPRYHFREVGIWSEDAIVKFYQPRNGAHVSHSITNLQNTDGFISVPVMRLDAILRTNGHGHLSLLKLDIEGAETTVLESIVAASIEIDVLLVEFDQLLRPTLGALRRSRAAIRRLFGFGYEVFWIDGRNLTFILTRRSSAEAT